MIHVKVMFTLKDTRVLTVKYSYPLIPGNTSCLPEDSYPDEAGDPSEPEYQLGDEDVSFDELPKGLAYLAEDMYAEGESGKYKYSTTEDHNDEAFYDPAEWQD